MTHHYTYGGSTAARTINCHAWQRLSAELPRSGTSSPAAALGTALHYVLEQCLLDVELNPLDYADCTVEGVAITEDHITDKIFPALDAFEDLLDAYDIDEYYCEQSYEFASDIGGTADFVGFSSDGKTIVLADYKSGDGIMVEAKNNMQNLFYAMCMRYDKTIAKKLQVPDLKIVLAIVQPSLRNDTTLKTWETNSERLEDFEDEFIYAYDVNESGEGEPSTGTHCAFCPAEAVCPKKHELIENLDKTTEYETQLEQLPKALVMADEADQWVKAVRKFAFEAAEKGHVIGNHKLVAKRAQRKWVDEKNVLKWLKKKRKLKLSDATEVSVLSPAKLEKVCKKHGANFQDFQEFIISRSSGSTLVKDTDPRPALALDGVKFLNSRFPENKKLNQTSKQTDGATK